MKNLPAQLLRTVFCLNLVLLTNSAVALGQDEQPANRWPTAHGETAPSLLAETAVEQPPCAGCGNSDFGPSGCFPRWTASADFIILDRIGSVNQTLVERVPRSVPLRDLPNTHGTELLDSNDLQQGFASGPRVDLVRHGDCGFDLELSYFQIDGWNSDRAIGPDRTDWLIMRSPGVFLQTQELFAKQVMAWDYAARLYNAECNLRWHPCSQITMLAGFRWLDLRENLQGVLEPPTIRREPPFWNTTATNNLYGFQIGADGKLFERGRLAIDGLAKAGIFDNNAEEASEVSVYKIARPSSASTDHAAFAGEIGLQCTYQVTRRLLLKAGYEALWLQGVAQAPGQIQETYFPAPTTPQALGVNCNSGVFYHGATVGFEFSF